MEINVLSVFPVHLVLRLAFGEVFCLEDDTIVMENFKKLVPESSMLPVIGMGGWGGRLCMKKSSFIFKSKSESLIM